MAVGSLSNASMMSMYMDLKWSLLTGALLWN
jgi:hypothetical protein